MTKSPKKDPVPRDDAQRPEDAVTPRRDFLRSLGVFGFAAAGGPLLGQSLWLRDGALGCGMPGDRPTTLTVSSSQTKTYAFTIPGTYTETGTGQPPSGNGTYTQSGRPFPTEVFTYTRPFPAPDGGTQTVTIEETNSYSYTPPATVTHTYSWNSNSFTFTASRKPTYNTVTLSRSYSASYTSTTPCEDEPLPEEPLMAERECPPAKSGARVATVDADGWDPCDALTRGAGPMQLRLGSQYGI